MFAETLLILHIFLYGWMLTKCHADYFSVLSKQVLLSADYFCKFLLKYVILCVDKFVGSKMAEMSHLGRSLYNLTTGQD
jgi:hypothetical protein